MMMKRGVILISLMMLMCSAEAQMSKLIGSWQILKIVVGDDTKEGMESVIIFEEGGALKVARSVQSESVVMGTWSYSEDSNVITMDSKRDKDFNGDVDVKELDSSKLIYKQGGAILHFKRVDPSSTSIPDITELPTLEFTKDEFIDEEDGWSEEDEVVKLPWKIANTAMEVINYSDIIYTLSKFREGEAAPDNLVSYKVVYSEDDNSLDTRLYSITGEDYIDISGYILDLNNLEQYKGTLHFYPLNRLDIYRVVGVEPIATALGTFDCTVVEGFGDFDSRVKYWMINSKPGVFAKIITVDDGDSPFGYRYLYKLQEIKGVE